jgi:putative ABC transport system permease protein
MLRFAPYVLKNLWRHGTRTALTVTGAAIALFIFCFVGAIQEGMAGLARLSERQLIVFQANRYCPSTSQMPEYYTGAIAKMPGVQDVVPIKVYTNNCRASLDVVVFYGMPAEKVRSARDVNLVEGEWGEFVNHRDGALIGQAVARRRGLRVGERFSIGQVTVTVAGIFSAKTSAEENLIYTHLDFLQYTRGLNAVGTVTEFEVRLTDDADADAVARAIDDRYRGGPIQTDTRTKGVFQARAVGDLGELIHFTNYLGYACVALVLCLVSTTTVMAVQDRVREHALLQAIGFSGRRIFALVLSESLVVSFVGGIIGTLAALVVLAWSHLAIGTQGVTIAFTPSLSLALTGFGVTAAIGCLGGFVPAWQAAHGDIVSSLRYE